MNKLFISINIDSAARGKGFGNLLIREMILVEKNNQTPELFASVKSNNVASLALFKSCGFNEQYHETPLDDLILLKKILTS